MQSYKDWKKRHTNGDFDQYRQQKEQEAGSGVKDAIRDAYAPIYSNIDRQFGELPGRRTEREAYVGDIYGQNLSSIGQGAEYSQAKVDTQKTAQGVEQEGALRDIAADTRNAMVAGNRYLGVRGASDSSATDQMSFALQKAANKENSNVRSQYASNMGQLDQSSADIEFQAQGARNELGMWKSDSLMQVSNWFQSQWDSLESQKATAQGNEAQQLVSMQTMVLQNTLNQLAQIDQMNTQNEQYIDNWKMERSAALEDYEARLNIESKFTGNPISASGVTFNPINTTPQKSTVVAPGGVLSGGGGGSSRNIGGTWGALKDYIFNPSGRM